MKKILVFVLFFLAFVMLSCKKWESEDFYKEHIKAGNHSPNSFPSLIEGTKHWGGECTLEYDPSKMVDPEFNFAYWNKLGGLMPDIIDNLLEGKHQSARVAWRTDPEDPNYIYLGYIIYVPGEKKPIRDYLYYGDSENSDNQEKVRIKNGETFFASVKHCLKSWEMHVCYDEKQGSVVYEDSTLTEEAFLVPLGLYYGGEPPAPTDIYLTIKVQDNSEHCK